jgi:hypothetical protein
VTDEPGSPARRRVTRGEGEVTEWPRGLVAYVPDGEEEVPSTDQDRTGNRLRLAARLLGLLRARGEEVGPELDQLRNAERAYVAQDRARATELVDRLLGDLDARVRSEGRPPGHR